MKILNKICDLFSNLLFNKNKYKTNSEAVIISCYFNPERNPYRLLAFQKFYSKIKHLNHRIIELSIEDDNKENKFDLPDSENIIKIRTSNLLFHKESLLNKIIKDLPEKFNYVFWVDADIVFTNNNWMVDSVKQMQTANIVQPFEYCVHLNKNEFEPNFPLCQIPVLSESIDDNSKFKRVWRSFCANFVDNKEAANSLNYDVHGHVGFAWGIRREILDACNLYDKALIGGADHIIAHAAANQIGHNCITKSFTDDLDSVLEWSKIFARLINQKVSYVKGNVYHYYHGDLNKRNYLKRIKDFTLALKNAQKDENGLYHILDKEVAAKIKEYYKIRESFVVDEEFHSMIEDFAFDMGYLLNEWMLLNLNFENTYYEESENTDSIEQDCNDNVDAVDQDCCNENFS